MSERETVHELDLDAYLARLGLSGRPTVAELHLAHVTHFNALLWDSGTTPVTVIEHGVIDPGRRWTGEPGCTGAAECRGRW